VRFNVKSPEAPSVIEAEPALNSSKFKQSSINKKVMNMKVDRNSIALNNLVSFYNFLAQTWLH